ncbi:glycosyltransferase [Halobacteriovorax sp.]|uniref:glycosyltransferase n=1 Tax=Halobacteriovorax sp. TaxID=2020862 RepID=UPI003AF249C8
MIPTFNDASNSYLFKNLEVFSKIKDIEVVISDGGSIDNTLSLCSRFGVTLIKGDSSSRAHRINAGIKASTSPMILLQHPRSFINLVGIEYLLKNIDNLGWGGFTHSFDYKHPILKFTSWYSNSIRGRIKGVLYLDHCIFLKRSMAESIGELPCVDIFEDTILSQRLFEEFGAPNILPYKVITSAIRFKTNGIFKQSLVNQFLKIKFHTGANHLDMNRLYEKNTKLNSNYEED